MSKTKDGFYKQIGGVIGNDDYLLRAGGGHIKLGNDSNNVPISNGVVNTNLNADMIDGYHLGDLYWANIQVQTSSDSTKQPTFGRTNITYAAQNGTSALQINAGSNSYAYALDIQSSIAINDTLVGLLVGTSHGTNNQLSGLFKYVGSGSTSNYFGFGFYGNDFLLNLRADGNVGIGTSSPSQKLDVNGNISIVNAGYITVQIDRFIYHKYDSTNTTNNLTILASGIQNAGKVQIRPYHIDNDSYSTTFLSNGNVGISNTNPAYKLDVNGNVYSSGFRHSAHNDNNAVLLAGAGWELLSNLSLTHNHDNIYVNVTGDTMTGALTIKGVVDTDQYSQGGFNKAYANIILQGDNTYGVSGIVFKSMKGNDTDINTPSDVAFIQYHPMGVTAAPYNTTPTEASSGERSRLVIGIGNDSNTPTSSVGEELWLQTAGANDLKHYVVDTGYIIWDAGNDGSGSGLDADLLDGYHKTDLIGNLTKDSWNPRGTNLAMDWYYNGGDMSISESGGQLSISVDGFFYQNEGQYRVLDENNYVNYLGYIGTTGVQASSAIQSLSGISSLHMNSSGDEQYINFYKDNTIKNQIDSGPTLFEIFSYNSGWRSDLSIVRATGNIGIGTNAPTAKLQVNGNVVISNNTLWVQSSASYGGTSNRFSLSSGNPTDMPYTGSNTGKVGLMLYSNAIAIRDPYWSSGTYPNDSCWIRHVEETNNAGYMELAVGDDASNEYIYFRGYNTSSAISWQSYFAPGGKLYGPGYYHTSYGRSDYVLTSDGGAVAISSLTSSGDSVSWTQHQTSGTHIATITINGSSTYVYAPSSSTSGNYHPLGGSWKPSSLSSYTRHWGWAYSSAEAGLASNGSDMQIYTDGRFWQREGAYYCLDNGNTYVSSGTGVINGTTITQVSNADTVDSYHASGLFETLSYSGSTLTVKIGGTTKTCTISGGSSTSGAYLPLAGGTMTGETIFSSGSDASAFRPDKNNYHYIGTESYRWWKAYINNIYGTFHHKDMNSDDYVLLAGGGYKAISNLVVASSRHADELDGYHASDLFQTLSYSGSTLTVKIGGTTKTCTISSGSGSGGGISGIDISSYSSTFYPCGHTSYSGSTLTSLKAYSGFYVSSSGAFHSSDIRLKYDISDILCQDVTKLFETENGFIRHYKWKNTNKDAYGFIAQELIEYCPEAVDISEMDNLYTVNYNVAFSKIIGAMFKKMKEQDIIIKELKDKINKGGAY